MLAWLLNKAVVAMGAVRLINMISRRYQDITLGGGTAGAISSPDHVGCEKSIGCGLIEGVLVITACRATPRWHRHVFGILRISGIPIKAKELTSFVSYIKIKSPINLRLDV